MAAFAYGAYTVGMDRDGLSRQTALRLRADEAITAALAAADARAPSLPALVEDTMASIDLACGDNTLGARDRTALIDAALLLLASMKTLLRAPQAARPGLTLEVVRRTNALLRRYARLVRAGRTGA